TFEPFGRSLKNDNGDGSSSSTEDNEERGDGELDGALFLLPLSLFFVMSKESMTCSCKVKLRVMELRFMLRMCNVFEETS
nr:hypothetical protein [Tanacetum cinerariifolium]